MKIGGTGPALEGLRIAGLIAMAAKKGLKTVAVINVDELFARAPELVTVRAG